MVTEALTRIGLEVEGVENPGASAAPRSASPRC